MRIILPPPGLFRMFLSHRGAAIADRLPATARRGGDSRRHGRLRRPMDIAAPAG
jgi:hypothetical protein